MIGQVPDEPKRPSDAAVSADAAQSRLVGSLDRKKLWVWESDQSERRVAAVYGR